MSLAKPVRVGFSFVGLALFLLLLFSRSFQHLLKTSGAMVTYPIVRVCHYLTAPLCKKREGFAQLQQRCDELVRQNATLLQENLSLRSYLRYERVTRELHDFQKRYALSDAICAQVLVKNLAHDQHYIVIDKGERDGVVKDMMVTHLVQLVGKVVEVFSWYSKVLLISDRRCNVAAFIKGSTASGMVRGTNTLNTCLLEYVHKAFPVKKGDLVISSGQGLIFSQGFCLGKVSDYRDEESSYHIDVKPLIDLRMLSCCLLFSREKVKDFC